MLKLQKFIKENSNWKELLSQKPYCITIKEDGDFVLFSYSQIDSDFSNPIVQECRGIILDKYFNIVCFPFTKFFNVQEQNAAQIDWSTARVQEKIDGSIIKLWYYNGQWRISTNGTINAFNAELQLKNETMNSYGDLFASVFPIDVYGILDKGYTYMFELVSPLNKVVIPYSETKIYHIGTRDNFTLNELDVDIEIEKPRQYNLFSLDDCLNSAEQLPFNEEGYVVVDANYNRVKIKSPAYVAAHHLKNNGVITNERIVDMIRVNGQDDFLSYYPEYKEQFEYVLEKIIIFKNKLQDDFNSFFSMTFVTRKDMAMFVNQTIAPSALYCIADKKVDDVNEWFWNLQSDKIVKMIGVK